MSAYQYSVATDFGGQVDGETFERDLRASAAAPRLTFWDRAGDVVSVHGDFDPGDQAVVDAVVAAQVVDPLALHKRALIVLVDDETERRILSGFTFAGKVFSTSSNAQSKWNGVINLDALGLIDYELDPPVINTLDDLEEFTIPDHDTLIAMYGTLSITIRNHLTVGRIAKADILAAADEAEADAIFEAFLHP